MYNPGTQYFFFKTCGGENRDACGDVWIVSPTGKRTQIMFSDSWGEQQSPDDLAIRQYDPWLLY